MTKANQLADILKIDTDRKAYLLLALFSVLFMVPHSMAFWGNGNYPTDACSFLRESLWVIDGLTMYTDVFELKGPLVYAYCVPLLKLGGLTAIWLGDMAVLFLILFILYRAARQMLEKAPSLLITLCMGVYMNIAYQDEMSFDMIATVGVAYGCYLVAKHLQDDDYCSFWEIVLFMAGVSLCVFTKLNNSAPLIPIALWMIYRLVRRWNGSVFLHYAFGVITGCVLFVLPVILWLLYRGNLEACYNAYVRYSLSNYGGSTGWEHWLPVVYVTLVALPGYVLYLWYALTTNRRSEQFVLLTSVLLLTLLLTIYSGNSYLHYFWPCYPVFALVWICGYKTMLLKPKCHYALMGLILFWGIVFFVVRCWKYLPPFDTVSDSVTADYINSNISRDDYVLVCNLDERESLGWTNPLYCFPYREWMLIHAKPASRFWSKPPQMPDWAWNELMTSVAQKKPKFIICGQEDISTFTPLGYALDRPANERFVILQFNSTK